METNNTNSRSNKGLLGLLILAIIGLLIFAFFFRDPINKVELSKIENHLISLDSARLLETEYLNTRYRVINESLGYNDTREFWVSLDFLENYIAYVKEESKKSGYENLGIRIYNTAYPKKETDSRAQPGFSTVVLVPTYQIRNKANGILPMQPTNENTPNLSAGNYIGGGIPPKKM